jgi:RNA polymerase sigma factor (sigma-70 family)
MPRNSTSLTSTLHSLCAAAIDPSLSDRELVTRFVQQHDQAAFSALVRRHASIVWSVCRRVLGQHADIEDAVQATFVLLSRKAAGLKHPELVGAWLHAVARKVALKARNRQSRDRVVPLDQDVPHTQDPLDVLSGREVLAILDEELARLPEEYRAVLLLCCIEGKSREEAAQRLGWSEGSVKGRLERGRDLLSRRLSRRGLTLSAALGASLVWQTTTAYAARLSTGTILAPATPQAVALANAVAGSLGTGIWIKWGLVGALLLTGTGVGVGIWGSAQVEPSSRTYQQQVTSPNRVTPEQPKPEVGRPLAPPAADPQRKVGATLSGLLRGVDPELPRVTLRVREIDSTYPLANGVDIRIDGKAAAASDLAALGGKTRVTITLNPEGTEIVSLAAEGEMVTGTLLGVNAGRSTITLRRSMTDPKGSASTWPLSAGAMITLDGKPVALGEIREGNTVSARLSADGKHVLTLDAKSP